MQRVIASFYCRQENQAKKFLLLFLPFRLKWLFVFSFANTVDDLVPASDAIQLVVKNVFIILALWLVAATK